MKEWQGYKSTELDIVRHRPSTAPGARDVHGLLRQGQRARRDYFQPESHRGFLRCLSFGRISQAKPTDSL